MRGDHETLLATELVTPGAMAEELERRTFDGVAERLRVCLVETHERRAWCDILLVVDWFEERNQYGGTVDRAIRNCLSAWFDMPWPTKQMAMRRSNLEIDTRPKRMW